MARASAAAPSRSFGVMVLDLLEREPAVDDLERRGIDRERDRLTGVGEIGADLGQGAGGAHVRREQRDGEPAGQER